MGEHHPPHGHIPAGASTRATHQRVAPATGTAGLHRHGHSRVTPPRAQPGYTATGTAGLHRHGRSRVTPPRAQPGYTATGTAGLHRHGHSRVTPPRAQPGYTATGVAGWPPMSRYRAWRSTGGCGVLFLLDEFALDPDLDFLADDEPAIQDRVEAQAELLPVDLGRGAVRDPVSHHPGVVELAVLRHVEGYRAGVALDGQVAGQRVVVRVDRLDAGALEREEGVLLHLEEVGRADVVVPHRVVGTEAGGRDGHLDRRLLGVAGV